MSSVEIQWRWKESDIEVSDIEKAEKILNVKLPKAFVQCVLINNGAYPKPSAFLVNGLTEMFGSLLSLNQNDETNIINTFSFFQNTLPSGIIPFGKDPGGNMICFDYRSNKETPQIVFWDHEIEDIKFISNSFEEFLSMLHEADEE